MFNVARIHGSDELACANRKTDGWQLRGKTIDGWELRDREAYTVDASVSESSMRSMYLDIWTTGADRRYSRSTDCGRTCRGDSIGTSGTHSATHQRTELDCLEQYSEPYFEEIKVLQA